MEMIVNFLHLLNLLTLVTTLSGLTIKSSNLSFGNCDSTWKLPNFLNPAV